MFYPCAPKLRILQYFYYYRQRSTPEKWKCQPNHWLPLQLEVGSAKETWVVIQLTKEKTLHPCLQAFVSEALCAPWELSSLTITELLTLHLDHIHSPIH